MKLFEYMAKEIFRQEGIAVPAGRVANTPEEAARAVAELGPAALKSQVLVGGRGKAGGIKFASTPEEALQVAEQLLNMEIKGYRVETLLVEQKIGIEKEIYVAITVDGSARRPLLIASAQGGMDIEEVPEEYLVKLHLDINRGIMPYLAREISRRLGLAGDIYKQMTVLLQKLWQIFRRYDCELVEINPLVISDGKLLAADGKINIDDEAAFRYPAGLPRVEERTERERLAHELGISYVELDGDIAVMANGAGITMATLDILQYYGGRARNFMDAGGGASEEATARALEILLSTQPKAILINIFGGITRCDDVARAFVRVKEKLGITVPVVIRLVGTNQEEGVAILKEIGVEAYESMAEAAAKVVELAKQAG